jgi:Tfp pilus assembly protein PilN
VGAAELGALVRRSARRHFPVREEPLAAGAVRVPGPREGALAPTLAACAPAVLVEAVAAACAGAGFRLGRVVPGAAALAEASRRLLSVARRGRVAVVARTPEGGDLLLLQDGAVRRVLPLAPSAPGDALEAWEHVAAALRDEEAGDGGRVGCIVIVGAGEGADALRRVAHADEHFGPRLGSAPAVEALPADAFFALGAALAGARVPLLLPEAAVQARAYRARRRTVALAIASAGLLSFAAGAHLSGLRREVAAVRAARAEIAPAVARAREARANVESVRARLASVAALERGASGWTAEIAAVARALPDSAHLRTLAADSAGLRLGGLARSAAEVVPALEASPRFARVALAAPVRWEQGDAGERFDVAVPRAEDEGRRP